MMSMNDILPYIAVAASGVSVVVAIIKTNILSASHEKAIAAMLTKVNHINEELATSTENRKNLGLAIFRLEELKANRETVDSFRSDLHNLRVDIDKRFDRVENILENIRTKS